MELFFWRKIAYVQTEESRVTYLDPLVFTIFNAFIYPSDF